MGPKKGFQLLEINVISAQDLEPVSKKMRTYATAWMNPGRKLSSCVDTEGKNNPTWNDKFVFKVDEEFLRQDTSAVMIEIYAVHWLRDVLVGTVRVLVGNLIPPPTRSHAQNYTGMRFVALQVRRPSGRPQGILNIGVALLGSSMKSMALYRQLSMSAVGFRDLMEDPLSIQNLQESNTTTTTNVKPILLRSKSERSALDHLSTNGSSILNPKTKDTSILSITDRYNPFSKSKVGKASSVISVPNPPQVPTKNTKSGSVLSDSILSKESSGFRRMAADKTVDEKSLVRKPSPNKEKLSLAVPKYNNYVGGKKGNSVWSDSEVGPSPSEVAAAMMMAERKYPLDDKQSSVLDGWSVDESVEGLRSKLERWRMDLPPLYDRAATGGGYSTSSYKSSGRHTRRHSDGSTGLFSCFGNIFGYECQCICGKPPGRRSRSARFQSPSTLTPGRSFI
ncbi:Calcium-dependent lipid-binding (CaLB domain) family protein [Striga hermonthica]|uniref:Calcium-dependent lipid-binding (CaLB domain) family protein n=1 Tax=Striga hermonthica TaxID=68872 RepID=A0A9N7MYA4_STRHE|nr:Calcium-dependent lipid-binding (CaLB domain) family protein [Striga hermonthica]